MAADGRKDGRANERKNEADGIRGSAVGLDSVKHRNGGAERGDLGQRQVHENHAALHHVDPQVGVNPGQNQTGNERR